MGFSTAPQSFNVEPFQCGAMRILEKHSLQRNKGFM